eukprot:9542508-Alexandrium_andersonii.AAC.1
MRAWSVSGFGQSSFGLSPGRTAAQGFGSSRLPRMPPSTASCSLPGRTQLTRSAARPSAWRGSRSPRGKCWRTPGRALANASWRGLSDRRAASALP